MNAPVWDELDTRQKLRIVSSDIKQLLSELISLTSPGGELDTAVDESIASFEPLLQSLNIHKEDDVDIDDIDISLETIMKDVAAKRVQRRVSKSKSGNDDSTQSETSDLSSVWGRRKFLKNVDVSEVPSTSGTSETFKEPGPTPRRTRSKTILSQDKERTESTYETLTHYEPPGPSRLSGESGGARRKSKIRPSPVF